MKGGKGGTVLSPYFTEWMMGLPEGWVTDPAIWTGMRHDVAVRTMLKALGNGVVPRQAAAAVRILLDRATRAAS